MQWSWDFREYHEVLSRHEFVEGAVYKEVNNEPKISSLCPRPFLIYSPLPCYSTLSLHLSTTSLYLFPLRYSTSTAPSTTSTTMNPTSTPMSSPDHSPETLYELLDELLPPTPMDSVLLTTNNNPINPISDLSQVCYADKCSPACTALPLPRPLPSRSSAVFGLHSTLPMILACQMLSALVAGLVKGILMLFGVRKVPYVWIFGMVSLLLVNAKESMLMEG